jgi:ribonuclease PH
MEKQLRSDGRKSDALRPLSFKRRYTRMAAGSVLVRLGQTTVLCTCSVEEGVPPFLVGTGKGWLTAEYSMLPGSTRPRKQRDRLGKVDGRSVEIQRLIGRSLRSVVHLERLGERTLAIDCDVLEADGGTRTAAINGAFAAVADALAASANLLPAGQAILQDSVGAISVGIVNGVPMLDLCYEEDRDAEVDMNLVMTGSGKLVEVQGTGEEATFTRKQLDQMLELGSQGIEAITGKQKQSLGKNWPLD